MVINDLRLGVAWAMAASICGIVLTTLNSVLFKRCKLEEESGKNSFFSLDAVKTFTGITF